MLSGLCDKPKYYLSSGRGVNNLKILGKTCWFKKKLSVTLYSSEVSQDKIHIL